MTLRQHLLQGAVISPLLAPFWGVENSVVFFLSFVLIDIDHYLLSIQKTGSYSVKGMFDYCKRMNKLRGPVISYCMFHSIEAVLFLLLAGFFLSSLFFVILCGFLAHILFDMYYLSVTQRFFARTYSFPEYLIRKNTGKYITNLPEFERSR